MNNNDSKNNILEKPLKNLDEIDLNLSNSVGKSVPKFAISNLLQVIANS